MERKVIVIPSKAELHHFNSDFFFLYIYLPCWLKLIFKVLCTLFCLFVTVSSDLMGERRAYGAVQNPLVSINVFSKPVAILWPFVKQLFNVLF